MQQLIVRSWLDAHQEKGKEESKPHGDSTAWFYLLMPDANN